MHHQQSPEILHLPTLHTRGDARGAGPEECIVRRISLDARPDTDFEICVLGALLLHNGRISHRVRERVGRGQSTDARVAISLEEVSREVGVDVVL